MVSNDFKKQGDNKNGFKRYTIKEFNICKYLQMSQNQKRQQRKK